MQNKYWHGECQHETEKELLYTSRKGSGYRGYWYEKRFCLDHEVYFCKCGWQTGYHYGYLTDTKNVETVKSKNMETLLRVYEASIC